MLSRIRTATGTERSEIRSWPWKWNLLRQDGHVQKPLAIVPVNQETRSAAGRIAETRLHRHSRDSGDTFSAVSRDSRALERRGTGSPQILQHMIRTQSLTSTSSSNNSLRRSCAPLQTASAKLSTSAARPRQESGPLRVHVGSGHRHSEFMKHPVDEMRNNRKLNGTRVKAEPGGHGGHSAFTCAKIEHPLDFVFAVRISILDIHGWCRSSAIPAAIEASSPVTTRLSFPGSVEPVR